MVCEWHRGRTSTVERELATKAPRTQGGAESHSGQRAGVAPFALQMQATVAGTLVLPARRAGLARVQLRQRGREYCSVRTRKENQAVKLAKSARRPRHVGCVGGRWGDGG